MVFIQNTCWFSDIIDFAMKQIYIFKVHLKDLNKKNITPTLLVTMTAALAWSSEVELHLTYHYLHRNIKKNKITFLTRVKPVCH